MYIDFVINFDLATEVIEKLKVKNTLFAELDEVNLIKLLPITY